MVCLTCLSGLTISNIDSWFASGNRRRRGTYTRGPQILVPLLPVRCPGGVPTHEALRQWLKKTLPSDLRPRSREERPFRLLLVQKYQVRLYLRFDPSPHLTSPHLPYLASNPTQPIDGDASPRPRAHTATHTYSYLHLLHSYSQQQSHPPSASGLKSVGRRGRASIQIIERERTPTSRTAPAPAPQQSTKTKYEYSTTAY